MAHMEFTMLSTDLRRDPKWRTLESHKVARLAYLSFMTSSLISFTGHFHLPLAVFTYESMIPRQDLLDALKTLQGADLVEFDQTTEFVRIVGWFDQRRTPCNANRLKAALKNYKQPHLPTDAMTARSLAELSVAALIRSISFKADTEESRKHKGGFVAQMV